MHHGDVTDSSSILHIIEKTKPSEIYNLAAQSHVAVSFEVPEYTANSDALGTLRILEAIKSLKLQKKTVFIRQVHQKCLLGFKKFLKMKKLLFIPEVPMELQRYMLTG